jgi:hypothetical protein
MADERKTSMNLTHLKRVTLVAAMLLTVTCLGLAGCASTDESSSGNGGDSGLSCDADPGQKKCLD